MRILRALARTTAPLALVLALGLAASACYYPEIPATFDGGDVVDESAIGVDGEVIPTFNNCRAESFVDRTADGATRVVSFGGANGSSTFGYSPRCLIVAAGQTVDFQGEFATHPLSPGTGPSATTAGTAGNPIPATGGGSAITVTFAAPGTYPYFCAMHVASGMAGVVYVRQP